MGLLSATSVQAQNYNTKCLGISAGYMFDTENVQAGVFMHLPFAKKLASSAVGQLHILAPRPQRMGNQREHSLPHSFRRSILGISLSRYRVSKLEGKCVTKR